MYIDKKQLLESLSINDVIMICSELGSPNYKFDNQGNICLSTFICHGGDSPYKLIYYADSKRFHCYTCNDSYDIVELVIRGFRQQHKAMTYYKALHWIAQKTKKTSFVLTENPEKQETLEDFQWLSHFKRLQKRKRGIPTIKEIPETYLEIYSYIYHTSWIEDNISTEAMNRFDVGYAAYENAISIPHRDINGRLIGIRLRYLDEEDIETIGKYVPAMIQGEFMSHRLGENFYGIHVTKDKIKSLKKVMIVEAEKSVLQAYTYFGDDSFVIASCGSNLTKTQIQILLKELEVNEVIYAPDRDYHDAHTFEAEAWYAKQMKKLKDFIPYCDVYLIADSQDRLGYKDSPLDKGKEIFLQLYEEKIHITQEELKRLDNG